MLSTLSRKPEILTEDEIADLGYLARSCTECYRAHHHRDDDRNLGRNWYYCPTCGYDWYPADSAPRIWSAPDIIINLVFVVFLVAGFIGSMVTAGLVARYDWHWSRDAATAASMWIGIPAWAIAVTVATTAIRWISYGLHDAFDYVWGPPLSWFDTVPRRPRA